MNAPTTVPAPRGWRDRAACRTTDPDLHFPVGTTGPALLQIAEAKAVCRRCPVMDTCRQWALDHRVSHGVFGGMSEGERYLELRRRQPSRIAAAARKRAAVGAVGPRGETPRLRGQNLAAQRGVEVLAAVLAGEPHEEIAARYVTDVETVVEAVRLLAPGRVPAAPYGRVVSVVELLIDRGEELREMRRARVPQALMAERLGLSAGRGSVRKALRVLDARAAAAGLMGVAA